MLNIFFYFHLFFQKKIALIISLCLNFIYIICFILININVFIIINNYVSHLLSWNKVRFAGVYLSLHIPCPFGTVLKAANEMHKDSRDSLFSEQNRFRLSDYNDLVSCSCCLVCTNCILFCLQSLYPF